MPGEGWWGWWWLSEVEEGEGRGVGVVEYEGRGTQLDKIESKIQFLNLLGNCQSASRHVG